MSKNKGNRSSPEKEIVNGPVPVMAQGSPVTVNGQTFKRKLITLPQLKFSDGATLYVRIESEIRISSVKGRPGKDGEVMKPADVCDVTDLQTGAMASIICGTVLSEKLKETFPGGKYVGHSFEITQHKVEGKRWRNYAIAELE